MTVDAPPPSVASLPEVQNLTDSLQRLADAYSTQDQASLSSAAKETSAAALRLLQLVGLAGSALTWAQSTGS